MIRIKIFQGDSWELAKKLDDESIDIIMTSPPYWALRDYNVEGQFGLEKTPEEYVKKLVDLFNILKNKLKKTGTLWVNIGDTYYTKSGGQFLNDNIRKNNDTTTGINIANELRGKPHTYLQSKSLTGIPFLFVIEMMKSGWIFRNTIIWHKNNVMPTSVKDRFTVDFEYVFFFVKNKKYYFKQQFEPLSQATIEDMKRRNKMITIDGSKGSKEFFSNKSQYALNKKNRTRDEFINFEKGRNKRTTWTINTKPFRGAHFAVFPEELCETPIDAGCPELVCKKCGQPVIEKRVSVGWIDDPNVKEVIFNDDKPYSVKKRKGFVEIRNNLPSLNELKNYLNNSRKELNLTIKEVEKLMKSKAPHHWFSGESYPTKEDWLKLKKILKFNDEYDRAMTEVKYKPADNLKSKYEVRKITCDCNVGFDKGVVLDPFMGSGTTGVVALKQNKEFIGFELNKDYIDIAKKRIKESMGENK